MGTTPKPPLGGLWGRDHELAILSDAWDAARTGQPSTILVGGDAGIGKTRLLTEHATRTTAKVLWGACLPLGERGVPYLPLIEMIRALDDADRGLLPPALEVLAPSREKAGEKRASNRIHLFQSTIDFFTHLASNEPLLLVMEDLHWADRSTRDLIDFLIGLLRNQSISLVASFRTDDLAPNHPLRTTLAEWLRRPSVQRLDLQPLSLEDSIRLIAPLLPGSVTRDQAMRLAERANGNPYFLEELAEAGVAMSPPPGRMRDFLLRRSSEVSPDLLRLLRIASAGGTTIDEDLLRDVAGLGLEQIRALLREGLEAHLLVIDDRGCRFRHALLAETLHEDLLPAERRDYHAAYADAFASRGDQAPAGELATHQAEAGRVDQALSAWLAAGGAAESQFAFAEALQSYRAALDLWESVADPVNIAGTSRVDLLRRMAEMAFLGGEFELAVRTAEEALNGIDPEKDPTTTGIVYHRLARYLRNTDRSDEALKVQERAVELIPTSPPTPERAEVLSGLALMLQFDNRYREARDVSLEAIEMAVATGAVHAEIQAKNTLGNTICTLEDVERGLSIIGEAHDLAKAAGDAHEQARSLWNLQANRYLGARLSEYVDSAEATIASLRIVQPHWVVDHMSDAADILHMLGRWKEADAMIDAARREDPTKADRIGVPELLIARRQFDEARALIAAAQPSIMVDIEMEIRELVFRADIEAWEGNPSEAIRLIDRALDQLPDMEKPAVIRLGIAIGIRAAADLARWGRFREQTTVEDEAIAIGEAFHRRMAEVMAQPGPADGWKREAAGLAAQCDAELSRLHGLPDPDAWLLADDRWRKLEMPYRAAYCRFRWAEDALASGSEREEVERVLRELSDMLASLGERLLRGEITTLARRSRLAVGDRRPSDRHGLTDREQEVLVHLARGWTNRQIADALYISEKTVSVHVSNILRKLVVGNRGEAAAKAISDGLVDVSELSTRG